MVHYGCEEIVQQVKWYETEDGEGVVERSVSTEPTTVRFLSCGKIIKKNTHNDHEVSGWKSN